MGTFHPFQQRTFLKSMDNKAYYKANKTKIIKINNALNLSVVETSEWVNKAETSEWVNKADKKLLNK